MTPLSAPAPSAAPASSGSPVSAVALESGGFAAILGGTEAAATSDEGDGADIPAVGASIEVALAVSVPVVSGKTSDTIGGKIGGNPGGKELPVTMPTDLLASSETSPSPDDEEPADTALTDAQPVTFDTSAAAALMATLAFVPVRPAEATPVAVSTGTDPQATIPLALPPASTLVTTPPVQTSPAVPTTTAPTVSVSPTPEAVAPPTVRLAPVELIAIDPPTPSTGTRMITAAADASLAVNAAVVAPAAPLQPQATPAAKTALDPQSTSITSAATDTPTSPRSASAESTLDTVAASPQQRPVPKIAESDSRTPVATAPLPESTVAISNATPVAAATVTSTNIASVQTAEAPQDFATLVGKLSEAREAASPHLVRTAVTHTEFGAVSLQFRPEGGGLSVTMANADPAFASAVHAGLAASFAGADATGNGSGDTARNDARQAWQQSAGGNSAQGAANQFGQDQRQASSQSAATSQQDSERRASGSATAQASPETEREATGAARSTAQKPGRSGIYA